ncbi:MAG: glycoside hydrolase family 130 protein [Treponemataceae bacterium]|nr:MAG: glycoside hydrolase family 130 protein [Treponemataceae bacterium]
MQNTTVHAIDGHSIDRAIENPLLTVADVKPTIHELCAVGIFNPACVKTADGVILLCRLAESAVTPDNLDNSAEIKIPTGASGGKISFTTFNRNDMHIDVSDNRVIKDSRTQRVLALSSFSTIRKAVSKDGIHFTLDDTPLFFPNSADEEWGTEDPRITILENKYYITYSAVSHNGVGVVLCETTDFVNFTRHGMIIPPQNKDAVLFPEKIGGKYFLLHRPVTDGLGACDIWIAESDDLIHWGNHRHVAGCDTGHDWEIAKIGAGAPPIRIPEGFLVLYHGVDCGQCYRVGALLLDAAHPERVIARTAKPIFEPEMPYERNGFFANTVFPCGAFLLGEKLVVYYGGADCCVCRVDIPLQKIMDMLV